MFSQDLMVFLYLGKLYVWELTDRVLYDFTIDFASIDDFLSNDPIKMWVPGTLPPPLVVLKEESDLDNSVFRAKEVEWNKFVGICQDEGRKEDDDEIDLGESWNSFMKAW